MLHVQIGSSCVRVAFCIKCSVGVPVLLETYFISRFVKSNFPLEWNIARYDSKPIQIFAINDQSKIRHGDNMAGDAICTKTELAPSLVCVARQMKDMANIRENNARCDRRKGASSNKTTTRVGKYSSADDGQENY